ncbi:MAG TPA: CDP-alcohol phosphatidyltransferase family protein [Allosphingosinicella sp.]|jgi:phosphatidylglycerophosphate synthase
MAWRRLTWFWTVQGLTAARVVLAFLFVSLSPFPDLRYLVAGAYTAAWATDFIDGRLARAHKVASRFGGAMDVFGDRYITVLSLLYAGVRGVALPVLGIILLRELYSVAMRMVLVNGRGVMMSNPKVGGVVHLILGGGTINLLCRPYTAVSTLDQVPFAVIASFYLVYLPWTILRSRGTIMVSVKDDLQ